MYVCMHVCCTDLVEMFMDILLLRSATAFKRAMQPQFALPTRPHTSWDGILITSGISTTPETLLYNGYLPQLPSVTTDGSHPRKAYVYKGLV